MPVTTKSRTVTSAEVWDTRTKSDKFHQVTSPEQLLSLTTTDDGGGFSRGKDGRASSQKKPTIIQSSFADLAEQEPAVFAAKNGLVFAAIEAYNNHHNLIIRPDDVWLAILTQLSTYVNANAEDLRSLFVDHSDQKNLHIEVNQLDGLDHGRMAFLMTKVMSENMKDPSLRDWVLPAFSTTDKKDQAVASIVFMGTMQKYFVYSWGTRCGIPAVTLLGDADDWVEIAQRCADRLGSGGFGDEAKRWYQVLKPVLDGFVETFRNPTQKEARKFWEGIVDKNVPDGSGSITYSGWITAFCYWDEKGTCLHQQPSSSPSSSQLKRGPRLTRSDVPMGFSKVPVNLVDMGNVIPTEMIAGSVALKGVRPADAALSSSSSTVHGKVSGKSDGFDTIQPVSGWFMYRTT